MTSNTEATPRTGGATLADLLSMPARMTLPRAGSYFGLARSSSYAAHDRGDFPVPVLQIGERFYCRGADVARALGVDPAELLARHLERQQATSAAEATGGAA